MAQLEAFDTGAYGPHASWWKMHHGHTRSWPHENDWSRMELLSSRLPPRHHRRWDEIQELHDIHRPAQSAYAAPSSVATSRQRPAVTRAASVLLSSPLGMRHHSSDIPLLGRPPAVPSFPRASTAPTGKAAFQNYNTRAPPNLRRAASHRDLSPRSAAHYLRSTPDSRRSMRSSLSESDNETDLTRPTPEQDDDDDENGDLAGHGTESIIVDKQMLRDRMDIRKRPSQEYVSASSSKPRSSRQSQKQKQKRRGRGREDDFDLDDEEDDDSIRQQDQQDYNPRSPLKRSHHGRRSRRGSGSRGAGGASSSRGRRRESAIPEEAAEEPHEADADSEMDNDDIDDERRRRRTPSRHSRRSVSRHTTATHDIRRELSRSKSRLRNADSTDFDPRSSSRRPTRRYCESELPDQYASNPATLRRAQTHPTAPSHVTAPPSIDSSKKPASLYESPLGDGSHAYPTEKSSKRNSCTECMDEFPSSRLAKLDCGHRMCTTCLKNKFKASMIDSHQMPPRCCTMDAISLRHVEKLFDPNFKQAWNYEYYNVSSGRRIYCPSTRCSHGHWIKKEHIYRAEDGRQMATCDRCHTRVCCLCNNKLHSSRECPRDKGMQRFLAEVRGRQNCYKCKSELELEEGRNHMICQCGAESCMICGAKWGHCNCPVFDFDTDRAGYGHLQYPPAGASRHDRFGSAVATRDFRPTNTGGNRPYSAGEPTRSRPQSSYEDRLRGRLDRDDYRPDDFRSDAYRDHELSRQMGGFGLDDRDDTADAFDSAIKKGRLDRYARRHAKDDMGAAVRRRRSFVDDADDDYPARAATDILPSVPQPPPAPPTPPQQQIQAPPPQHRYQHQHQQAPPSYPAHHTPQHHSLYAQPEEHEQHQRSAPPPSQYPAHSYDRPTATTAAPAPAPTDYYGSGLSRTRAVNTDSQVGRLASRFSPANRTKAAPPGPPGPPMTAGVPLGVAAPPGGGMGVVPMGPISPNGPMAPMPPMPPMVSMPGPLPPPPPPMGSMPMMSMAPIPPPGMMSELPLMRRHPMEDDRYMGHHTLGHGRSAEQMPFASYPEEDEYIFSSGGGGGGSGRRHRHRDEEADHAQKARASEMAGLAGLGRGMDRVPEWMDHVGNDPPDSESALDAS